MAVRRAPDASFGASSLVLPRLPGVLGLHLHGTSEAETILNRANPAIPGSVLGPPVYHPGFIDTTSNAPATLKHFDTGIVPPAGDCCLMIAARRQVSGALISAVGVNAEGQTVKFGIFGTATGPSFRNSFTSASGAAVAPWPSGSTTDFFVIFAFASERGWPSIRIGFNDQLGPVYSGPQSLASGIPPRALTGNLIVNPDAEGNVAGASHADAVWNRIPPADELLDAYRRIRARANTIGEVTVA